MSAPKQKGPQSVPEEPQIREPDYPRGAPIVPGTEHFTPFTRQLHLLHFWKKGNGPALVDAYNAQNPDRPVRDSQIVRFLHAKKGNREVKVHKWEHGKLMGMLPGWLHEQYSDEGH